MCIYNEVSELDSDLMRDQQRAAWYIRNQISMAELFWSI